MTVKEFLRDIKRKNTSIEILNEQLEKLRSIALKASFIPPTFTMNMKEELMNYKEILI